MILALAFAALGCGRDLFSSPIPPEPKPAVTRATEAVFEERDETGVVQWAVWTARMEQESGVVTCDSMRLTVPPVSGRENLRGMIAWAASGTYMHAADTPTATLEKGFEMTMENGWNAQGSNALWNGRTVHATDSVTLSRTSSIIHGRDAVITPDRNRIIVHDVNGEIGDLSL